MWLEFGLPADLELAVGFVGVEGADRDEAALALEIRMEGGVHALRELLGRLDAAPIEVEAMTVRAADPEDVFLSLTGRSGSQEAPKP